MKSTAQGNLQIVSDRLIFCYDVANPKSYSTFKELELRNLAKIDDYILLESGSTAVIEQYVEYKPEYGGGLQCNDSGSIQFPGFADITLSDYTIEFVISPDTLNNTTPAEENYIIKSDNPDGLFIKYYGSDQTQLEYGNGTSTDRHVTDMQANNYVYHFLLTYDSITDNYEIFVGFNSERYDKKGGLWGTINYPFKIGYNFDIFKLFQFRIYNKVLSPAEIEVNREQFKRRYGAALA